MATLANGARDRVTDFFELWVAGGKKGDGAAKLGEHYQDRTSL